MKTCKLCGSEVLRERSTAQFCSEKCEWRWPYKHGKKRLHHFKKKYGENAESAMLFYDLWKEINTKKEWKNESIIKRRRKNNERTKKAKKAKRINSAKP